MSTDFSILDTPVYQHRLVYFDNAATTQKPQCVIDSLVDYYQHYNANIHRGTHYLAAIATEAYERSRNRVQQFIHASKSCECIFTRGTTEAINLVAYSFSKRFLKPGDEVLVSGMEHHSDIVPWQLAADDRGFTLKVIPFDDNGVIDLDAYQRLFTNRTRLVAVCHVSNTLGTINPVKEMAQIAHSHGARILVDGAQAVAHLPVDVADIDCDFYCFSGHKMYGPMGVGVLYGKEELLADMPPFQGGGDMIKEVTFERTTYGELPFKFEAGTPAVGDVVALSTAIDYIEQQGIDHLVTHEQQLLHYATHQLQRIDGLRIIGTAPHKVGIMSFLLGQAHPYDTGVLLDKLGIAVRTGHHCTQPIMDHYGIPGTVRASFALYNTESEIDFLVESLLHIAPLLQ